MGAEGCGLWVSVADEARAASWPEGAVGKAEVRLSLGREPSGSAGSSWSQPGGPCAEKCRKSKGRGLRPTGAAVKNCRSSGSWSVNVRVGVDPEVSGAARAEFRRDSRVRRGAPSGRCSREPGSLADGSWWLGTIEWWGAAWGLLQRSDPARKGWRQFGGGLLARCGSIVEEPGSI